MELGWYDRTKIQSVVQDMVGCNDRRVAELFHRTVVSRWGSLGADHVLFLLAEDIVENAGSNARNAFARVTADTAFTPAQFEAMRERIISPTQRRASGTSRGDVVFELVAAFLNAVQRVDAEGQARVLSQLRRGEPGDHDAARDILLELAALHSPAAQTPPSPPAA
ncbi:hypothetical protein ACFWP3_19160 [Streptomyces sp. NPDC058525]|uniref:hypothetical protein n=1 Tax=Streptomyces sp. NPDC058525 TaxID=3346538 RepID=UPI0036567085